MNFEHALNSLQAIGVEELIFDVDETLMDTRGLFLQTIDAVSQIVDSEPQKYKDIIISLRKEHGVKPTIMFASLEELCREQGIGKETDRYRLAEQEVNALYDEHLPELFPGSRELLNTANQMGMPCYAMTHAGEEWTHRKLARYGDVFTDIVCFSVERRKSEQWQDVLAERNLTPANAILTGDNFEADLLVNLESGYHCVWVLNGIEASFGADDHNPTGREKFSNHPRLKKVEKIADFQHLRWS